MESDKLVYTFKDFNDEEIKVFLPKFEIDMGTMKQIKEMSRHLILKNIRIMPDCHRGVGCCVGMTAQIDDKIYPRYVGYDIGCGISTYPIDIDFKLSPINNDISSQISIEDNSTLLQKIEQLIQNKIPMGKSKNKEIQIRDDDWLYLYKKNNEDLQFLKEQVQDKYPDYEFPKEITKDYIINMIKKIDSDVTKHLKSIGTLGGGNHYVEVNYFITEDKKVESYLTIHSGSRNIGSLICKHHQDKIDNNCRFNYDEFKNEMKNIKRKFRNTKTIHEIETKLRDDMRSNLHPLYLEGHEMLDYLVDMIIGQNLASLNRMVMIRNVYEKLETGMKFTIDNMIETRHNYIDFSRFILRKGSVSAEKGEKCIISLNMKDGILLCEGKGNPDWNYLSAHGCGRILQRGQTSRLSMKQFREEMKDVYTTCVNKATLDESPMAYRNADLVKRCLGESVVITKQLRPIINCKGF